MWFKPRSPKFPIMRYINLSTKSTRPFHSLKRLLLSRPEMIGWILLANCLFLLIVFVFLLFYRGREFEASATNEEKTEESPKRARYIVILSFKCLISYPKISCNCWTGFLGSSALKNFSHRCLCYSSGVKIILFVSWKSELSWLLINWLLFFRVFNNSEVIFGGFEITSLCNFLGIFCFCELSCYFLGRSQIGSNEHPCPRFYRVPPLRGVYLVAGYYQNNMKNLALFYVVIPYFS